jgi:hypothetical protein
LSSRCNPEKAQQQQQNGNLLAANYDNYVVGVNVKGISRSKKQQDFETQQ